MQRTLLLNIYWSFYLIHCIIICDTVHLLLTIVSWFEIGALFDSQNLVRVPIFFILRNYLILLIRQHLLAISAFVRWLIHEAKGECLFHIWAKRWIHLCGSFTFKISGIEIIKFCGHFAFLEYKVPSEYFGVIEASYSILFQDPAFVRWVSSGDGALISSHAEPWRVFDWSHW